MAVAPNPDENVVCVISLYGPDRRTVEVAARMLEHAVPNQFIFHASNRTGDANSLLAFEARCIVVVRPEDRDKHKRSRWEQFSLAKAEQLSKLTEDDREVEALVAEAVAQDEDEVEFPD